MVVVSAHRRPVRFGTHRGKSLFRTLEGLHDDATGLVVVGAMGSSDPEVMFEEHRAGDGCRYFNVLPNSSEVDVRLGPGAADPDLRARCDDPDLRVAWIAMRAAFLVEEPGFVNELIAKLRCF